MEQITDKQTHRENDAWFDEAKTWVTEAGIWQRDQTLAVKTTRAELESLEALLQRTNGHVDALTTHLSTVRGEPTGPTHEKEREAHHVERGRHADLKKANHDLMRHGN